MCKPGRGPSPGPGWHWDLGLLSLQDYGKSTFVVEETQSLIFCDNSLNQRRHAVCPSMVIGVKVECVGPESGYLAGLLVEACRRSFLLASVFSTEYEASSSAERTVGEEGRHEQLSRRMESE